MRRVYFSFDYERDLDRVNKIRNVPGVIACAAAGFRGADVWETAKRRGDAAVQGLIRDGLNNTSVTVVCLGYMTAYRKHLTYELEQSLNRGNGVVGVQLHHLTNKGGESDEEGHVPPLIRIAGFQVCKFQNMRVLGEWIEEAAEVASQQSQRDRLKGVILRHDDNGDED
jgi:hypothetical protein